MFIRSSYQRSPARSSTWSFFNNQPKRPSAQITQVRKATPSQAVVRYKQLLGE